MRSLILIGIIVTNAALVALFVLNKTDVIGDLVFGILTFITMAISVSSNMLIIFRARKETKKGGQYA